jgi:hypothetical protein
MRRCPIGNWNDMKPYYTSKKKFQIVRHLMLGGEKCPTRDFLWVGIKLWGTDTIIISLNTGE